MMARSEVYRAAEMLLWSVDDWSELDPLLAHSYADSLLHAAWGVRTGEFRLLGPI
jgi:hypothetical protein